MTKGEPAMDALTASVIVAIITGACTAVPTIIATVKTQSVHEALQQAKLDEMNSKIDELSQEVRKYNDFDKRLAIIENIIFKRGLYNEVIKQGL